MENVTNRMAIKLYLKRIPVKFTLMVLVLFAVFVIKITYFDFLPELFQGANKLGMVFESAVLALVISTIFYNVVTVGDLVRKEKAFLEQSFPKVRQLVQMNIAFTSVILKGNYTSESFPQFPTDLETLKESMSAINYFERNTPVCYADSMLAYDWREYMNEHVNKSKELCNQIIEMYSLFRVEHKELLSRLSDFKNSAFFGLVTKVYRIKVQDHKISMYAKDFSEYQHELRKVVDLYSDSYDVKFDVPFRG
ncbi:hypothetical protein FM042_08005 [Aliidiomarina halalkaliphila]|uniref:Uncharacterized protein n=1 Tax=Aliidiomarina halalkaliphila TaxID=2593535 RepID=A0A552X1T9_9GAMM|nr:hypothetical protein [Aliidiomarina halalkaliphila]TRW48916.1 hypothetical protein FM042_08005 [Aliidiomarina halalkaliphila]